MNHISALELNQRLQANDLSPLLLDVREPHEFKYCRIAGSINIPMNQVPSRLTELDPQSDIIVICHHGMRSIQVAIFLDGKGFKQITNLTGGVAAWAKDIDPSMPTY
jgi:rhodanese-related sulfurtransferase